MSNALVPQIFDFDDHGIRVIKIQGDIWWVLKDICSVLGLSVPSIVVDRLDDDEKQRIDVTSNLGLKSNVPITIINESGLYKVLLRSDEPDAKKFKRWITHEVIPSIRKTGKYAVQFDPIQ
ncbi:MAG: hypothetical protein LBC74_02340 [Planctomycetaceae bacterium]|jgi:prophage antirepressor-like protein|nr:hypothetical protein [Planctomycetaceae bacterium]